MSGGHADIEITPMLPIVGTVSGYHLLDLTMPQLIRRLVWVARSTLHPPFLLALLTVMAAHGALFSGSTVVSLVAPTFLWEEITSKSDFDFYVFCSCTVEPASLGLTCDCARRAADALVAAFSGAQNVITTTTCQLPPDAPPQLLGIFNVSGLWPGVKIQIMSWQRRTFGATGLELIKDVLDKFDFSSAAGILLASLPDPAGGPTPVPVVAAAASRITGQAIPMAPTAGLSSEYSSKNPMAGVLGDLMPAAAQSAHKGLADSAKAALKELATCPAFYPPADGRRLTPHQLTLIGALDLYAARVFALADDRRLALAACSWVGSLSAVAYCGLIRRLQKVAKHGGRPWACLSLRQLEARMPACLVHKCLHLLLEYSLDADLVGPLSTELRGHLAANRFEAAFLSPALRANYTATFGVTREAMLGRLGQTEFGVRARKAAWVLAIGSASGKTEAAFMGNSAGPAKPMVLVDHRNWGGTAAGNVFIERDLSQVVGLADALKLAVAPAPWPPIRGPAAVTAFHVIHEVLACLPDLLARAAWLASLLGELRKLVAKGSTLTVFDRHLTGGHAEATWFDIMAPSFCAAAGWEVYKRVEQVYINNVSPGCREIHHSVGGAVLQLVLMN